MGRVAEEEVAGRQEGGAQWVCMCVERAGGEGVLGSRLNFAV